MKMLPFDDGFVRFVDGDGKEGKGKGISGSKSKRTSGNSYYNAYYYDYEARKNKRKFLKPLFYYRFQKFGLRKHKFGC